MAPGLFVSRDGSTQEVRRRGLSWSASSDELAELLLSQAWPEGFGTNELANRSGWSAPQVSQVLKGFDEQGWTSKYGPGRGRGAKRELVDPDGLLGAWSEVVVGQNVPRREASRTFSDPLRFLAEELAGSLEDHVRWALGGWAAADQVAPFMTTVPTLQIHVHEDDFRGPLEAAMRGSGLREVDGGGRVQFLATPPAILARSWSRRVGMPLVSPPRIYVDLMGLGPRGAEAAGHLKEEAIDPLHRRGQETGGPSEGLVVWERETRARLAERMGPAPSPGSRSAIATGPIRRATCCGGSTRGRRSPSSRGSSRTSSVRRPAGRPGSGPSGPAPMRTRSKPGSSRASSKTPPTPISGGPTRAGGCA